MQNRIISELYLYALFAVVFIFCISTLSDPAYSAQSANYSIDTDVLSGGGGECSSADYYLWHTTGQPTAIGISTSLSYKNYAGFWYTIVQPVVTTKAGDCNGDGKVSSADITACISEIFDGDGDLAQNTPGGTYAGNPIGCDPNCDGRVTSADITCTITRIFGGTCGVCP